MTLQLREYRASDLEALVALDETCFEDQFLFDWDSMVEFIEAPNAHTIVAEEEGDLAGFVIMHVDPAEESGKTRGYILTLDVAEASRRRGVAGMLMQAAEEQAAKTGAAWMELHVFIMNAAAILFYEGHGYTRIAVHVGFYGRGMDGYIYRKDLHPVHAR